MDVFNGDFAIENVVGNVFDTLREKNKSTEETQILIETNNKLTAQFENMTEEEIEGWRNEAVILAE